MPFGTHQLNYFEYSFSTGKSVTHHQLCLTVPSFLFCNWTTFPPPTSALCFPSSEYLKADTIDSFFLAISVLLIVDASGASDSFTISHLPIPFVKKSFVTTNSSTFCDCLCSCLPIHSCDQCWIISWLIRFCLLLLVDWIWNEEFA